MLEEGAKPNQRWSGLKSSAIEFFVSICIGVLVALIVWGFVMRPFIVHGLSMFPTFNSDSKNGDYIIAELISYNFIKNPERGDVVVIMGDESKEVAPYVVKRIIALPGETIRLSEGDVYIKEADSLEEYVLVEPYIEDEIKEGFIYKKQELSLGEDEYFVLGDNRNNSFDSRNWGAAKEDSILGRAFLRLLPITEISLYPGDI